MTKKQEGAGPPGARTKPQQSKIGENPGPPSGPGTSPVIIGIGASAGGVEALGRFFDAMPPDSGAAFVVILHLDPNRESQMAHVISTHTTMPVEQVMDEMSIAANRVYVIAPDRELKVRGGKLHVSEPVESRGHRHPVDVLFRSLAADQGERTIAIVLSGTGTNGTDGLKEVRAVGGLVLVQDPPTAKFDGMPRSAIAAGMADHVLAPGDMPDILMRYLRQEYVAHPGTGESGSEDGQPLIDQILQLLRMRSAHDFGNYKRLTMQRRIQRRLGLRNMSSLAAYLNDLRLNDDEVRALVKDLLINVTGFFRDAEVWRECADLVLAPLVAGRDTGAQIRIWVPGCSTGEEAYSIAMLLSDQATAAGKKFDIKIFATDARDDNLHTAREGMYPAAALVSLPPQRQVRFFDKLDGYSRIKKEVRDTVVFARQNLLSDPPFSRVDLVSCRNLLIYLEPAAQQRIIALCHFALRQDAYLLLGSAETIGRHGELFEAVSKKCRIYRRLGATRHDLVSFPVPGGLSSPSKETEGHKFPPAIEYGVTAAEAARRALLDRFAPASVLIDRHCHVLYFHGATGDYLEQPTGEPSRELFVMAREGLTQKLRGAVRTAIAENKEVTVTARIRHKQTTRPVKVTVTPLPVNTGGDARLLVSFDAQQPEPTPVDRHDSVNDLDEQVLRDELKSVRTELQVTIEDFDATNEELRASNEEITSMNEELQSTNEELETSKEELQSYNEELHTVNNELQHKIRELEDTTNDLNNLLAGNETATLFLDTELAIKWFTPATQDLFDLQQKDIGRSISHFAPKFTDPNLVSDAADVLRKLITLQTEVPGAAGKWYNRKMLPYRTQDNRVAGVVIAFTDVTERRRASAAVDEARIYAEAIVHTSRQPLLVLNDALKVVSANTAFLTMFHVSAADTNGRLIYELGNGQWDFPQLRRLLEDASLSSENFNDIEMEHDFHDIGNRCMLLNGRKLTRGGDREELILLGFEDITERKQVERHKEVLIGELNHRVKNILATVQAIAAQSFRSGGTMEEIHNAFRARLIALATAHDLLTDGNWEATDLGTVTRAILAPHRDLLGRFNIEGVHVGLSPATALTFTMALHEMCTNAIKYGALSDARGKVDISWSVTGDGDDKRLKFHWLESGGPQVTPPTRKGFGSRLIEQALAWELGGDVNLNYGSGGVSCVIDAPLPSIKPQMEVPYG